MTLHASKLDIEKFRKVQALMTGGATEGERAAAMSRAEAMARRAGLELNEAIKALKSDASATNVKSASDWASEWAAQAERERDPDRFFKEAFEKELRENRQKEADRKAERRAEVLGRYRTVFAVFEPNERERALRMAIVSFSFFAAHTGPAGHKRRSTYQLDKCHGDVTVEKLTKRARKAVENAYPMPATFAEAIEEVKFWDLLRRDREAFVGGEYPLEMEVQARVAILEEILQTAPANTWSDLESRFDWYRYDYLRQWLSPDDHANDYDEPEIARLRKDFEILRKASEGGGYTAPTPAQNGHSTPNGEGIARDDTPVQSGHRTNADKGAAVRDLLNSHPELSDREISRRAGVSPQTVGNWRARTSQTKLKGKYP